jgi:hypothetical protein
MQEILILNWFIYIEKEKSIKVFFAKRPEINHMSPVQEILWYIDLFKEKEKRIKVFLAKRLVVKDEITFSDLMQHHRRICK